MAWLFRQRKKIRWDAECDWSGVITKLYGGRGSVYCDASF
jgi:hypothetical protein